MSPTDALFDAAQRHNFADFCAALDDGASLRARHDNRFITGALFDSAGEDPVIFIEMLLDVGYPLEGWGFIDAVTKAPLPTPLEEALVAGRYASLERLREHGASVPGATSPLHAQYQAYALSARLDATMQAGAEPPAEPRRPRL